MTLCTYDTRSHVTNEDSSILSTICNVATSECITSFEKMLLSRFDELTNKPLNIKDTIIKNFNLRPDSLGKCQ